MSDIPKTLKDFTVPIDTLTPYGRNPRQGDIGAITQSLEAHGQYRPVVVNKPTMQILAGNHTWRAAKALGWTDLAVTFVDVDEETAARIVLVDNRTNDLATYDDIALSEMLKELNATPLELSGTGFDGDDLDQLMADLSDYDMEQVEDPYTPTIPDDPITQPGDLWGLGPHRLICGDSANPEVWEKLTDGPAAVVVTSPPYADRRDYDPSSGFRPIPPDDYVEWFSPIAANIHRHLAEDGSWFLNIKPGITPDGLNTELYVLDLVAAHVREWGFHLATEFCWERNGVPKSVTQRFKNQFEPIYQFTKGRWKMRPDQVRHQSANALTPFGPGAGKTAWDGRGDIAGQGVGQVLKGQRKRNTEWETVGADIQGTGTDNGPGEYIGPGLAYPGNRLPTFAGSHTALGHAAAYPVGLPQFFIEAFTDLGDSTLDPFAGTGSSLIAAENSDRIGLAIELSPAYCDVIIERYKSVSDGEVRKL